MPNQNSANSAVHTILVTDDMPIVREPIAAALRQAGYRVVCAANGREALTLIASEKPSLVLLDVHMPELDGLGVLRSLQTLPKEQRPRVILLTADADREQVVEAARLGVKDYMLKKSFSLSAMLERVAKCLSPQGDAPQQTIPPFPAAGSVVTDGVSSFPVRPEPITPQPASESAGPLLTREQCLARAEHALTARTLPGVMTQVITLAASPRASTSELSELIARDPMLSAKVLQAANSAAYAGGKGVITTIADAVRRIGFSAVRNIAVAAGVFDAMPQTTFDGFNPVRCWQHSFAVATLCERLAALKDPALGGQAYLVGLCHDLGEVLFRTHFAGEYARVLQEQAASGRPMQQVERELLGTTQHELAASILRCLQLPAAIREPIEAAQAGDTSHPLARILRLADVYANGMMLTASGAAVVFPITQGEARAAVGTIDPPSPDPQVFRGEVLALTTLLARLSTADTRALACPPYPKSVTRICLARERGLCGFDPVKTALDSLAQVELRDHLPSNEKASTFDGLIVASRSVNATGMTIADIQRCASDELSLLWIIPPEQAESASAQAAQVARPQSWSLTLDALAAFVAECTAGGNSRAAKPAA